MNALHAALRKDSDISPGFKQKLNRYIHNGAYDTETMLWLALFVDPVLRCTCGTTMSWINRRPALTKIAHRTGMP